MTEQDFENTDAAKMLDKLIKEIGATDLQEPPRHGEPEPWVFGVREGDEMFINIKMPDKDHIVVAVFEVETGAFKYGGIREMLTSSSGMLQ